MGSPGAGGLEHRLVDGEGDFVEGSAETNTLAVSNTDVGCVVIRWVNADCVQKVLISINKQLSDVISIR